jgi:aryl-alcohol dehydrogenase-like predicted oxidoreductase
MTTKATTDMTVNQLGNSDLYISPLGFGAWAIGGSGWEFGWGEQDDQASISAIHRALSLGVNWIDTAAVYGMGHSEEVVASALKAWSGPRPYVFTKCGLRWDEQGYVHRSLIADSIRGECEDSLRRLGVDVIDLYQIHWPTEDLEEGWGAMAELQKEGKVRWIGVSNFNVEEMRRAQAIAPITSLQPPYSLVRREAEEEILPYCRAEGIGVIVYSPMASGLLTGAMTRDRAANLPDSDWRSRDVEFHEPRLTKNLALVERLRTVSEFHGRVPGQVAIAWALHNPAVTGAIVGARNTKQVEETAGAADLCLADEKEDLPTGVDHGSLTKGNNEHRIYWLGHYGKPDGGESAKARPCLDRVQSHAG